MAQLTVQDIQAAREVWKSQVNSHFALSRDPQDRAWQRFLSLGLPNRKDEMWKYTDINLALSVPIKLKARKPETDVIASEPNTIVFQDGQLVTPSKTHSISGVRIANLVSGSILPEQVLEVFENAQKIEDGLLALSQSAPSDVVVIEVSKNIQLQKPIVLEHRWSGQATWIQPQILITVAEGSEVQFVEKFVDNSSAPIVFNSYVQVRLAARARLQFLRATAIQEKSVVVASMSVQQASQSFFHATQLSMGSALNRQFLGVEQLGPEAETTCQGLYLTESKQHCDHRVIVRHLAERGLSRQLYKGVLKDQSRAVFNGKIFIGKGAQKVDSQQLNKNLVLDPRAEADSKPELEVYADDVKANHGSAIGQLDPQQLFYLMSRAISRAEATRILAKGFMEEVVFNMPSKELQAFAHQWMGQALDHFQKSVEKIGEKQK